CLESCPRNSRANFWDRQATRMNNSCPAATGSLARRISDSGHWGTCSMRRTASSAEWASPASRCAAGATRIGSSPTTRMAGTGPGHDIVAALRGSGRSVQTAEFLRPLDKHEGPLGESPLLLAIGDGRDKLKKLASLFAKLLGRFGLMVLLVDH